MSRSNPAGVTMAALFFLLAGCGDGSEQDGSGQEPAPGSSSRGAGPTSGSNSAGATSQAASSAPGWSSSVTVPSSNTAPSSGTAGPSSGATAPSSGGALTVSGHVTRSVAVAQGQDGLGTLCLAIADACPSITHQSPQGFASLEIAGADLSASGAQVPFVFEGVALAEGQYVVTGYLMEGGGACTGTPARNDPVSFSLMGATPCPTLVVPADSPVTGLVLDLNFLMPF